VEKEISYYIIALLIGVLIGRLWAGMSRIIRGKSWEARTKKISLL
jgi:hypothetical protein